MDVYVYDVYIYISVKFLLDEHLLYLCYICVSVVAHASSARQYCRRNSGSRGSSLPLKSTLTPNSPTTCSLCASWPLITTAREIVISVFVHLYLNHNGPLMCICHIVIQWLIIILIFLKSRYIISLFSHIYASYGLCIKPSN